MLDIPLLLLQIAVILAVARLVGWLFKKMHQPQVVGEMVAGVLLGPSLLGLVAPNVSATLFPPESLGYLSALSQIGLVLFMFLVGLELEGTLLRSQGKVALFTSHASIAVLFFLGVVLALVLYPRFSNDSVTFLHFALFLGTALSITAFPVLARILTERKMLRTRLGAVTIASAAVNDVTGWIILAVIVLMIRSGAGATPAWLTFSGVISPSLFTMMVLMALATTFMTSPLLEWIYFSRVMPKEYEAREEEVQQDAPSFTIVD